MTPDAYTIKEDYLDVGDGHTLYLQEWGYPDAQTTVLFLHGGPGSSAQTKHKSNFDPSIHRVIFYDQRGCGNSTPYGSTSHNTTQDLIDDIEKIAEHFGLKQFVICGGSWGSCLAMAYALQHGERVKALIMYGIFTGSKQEAAWIDQGQFRDFFPDVWQQYLSVTPAEHHGDPSAYHFERILGDDAQAVIESGHAYDSLEGAVSRLDDEYIPQNIEDYDPNGIKLEVHYMNHGCFMPDRHILDNAAKLTMPVWLLQGRYDMVCPPKTAYELHQLLPNSHLLWTTSGHRQERESWHIMRTILSQA